MLFSEAILVILKFFETIRKILFDYVFLCYSICKFFNNLFQFGNVSCSKVLLVGHFDSKAT